MMVVTQRLEREMRLAKVNQSKLADALGVSRQSINQFIARARAGYGVRRETAEAVAKALGVSILKIVDRATM